jgi:hypothetical protein
MKNPWRLYRDKVRARRDEWKPVLEAEIRKWSSMNSAQIIAKLPDKNECYEVEFESTKYQVEVDLLENTERYIHVAVSVDDGSLPASFRPASSSFICNKSAPASDK